MPDNAAAEVQAARAAGGGGSRAQGVSLVTQGAAALIQDLQHRPSPRATRAELVGEGSGGGRKGGVGEGREEMVCGQWYHRVQLQRVSM
eukprot:179555-Rhodomonas_salina.2